MLTSYRWIWCLKERFGLKPVFKYIIIGGINATPSENRNVYNWKYFSYIDVTNM